MHRFYSALLFTGLLLPHYAAQAAADKNGYTSQYECRAGGSSCSVDVAAQMEASCDQTVSTGDTDWSKITSNPGSNVFCISPGDHTAKGVLALRFSGTAGSRKVLRASQGSNVPPWQVSDSERAVIAKIRLEGASYWTIGRLAIDGQGRTNGGDGVFIQAGSNNNIFHQLLIQRHHGYQFMADWNGINENNVVQNSVIRNAVLDRTFEAECVDTQKSRNMKFVNNEVYNCHKAFSVGSGVEDVRGLVLENNDFYIGSDYYTDCAGRFNGAGPCSGSEAVMSIKSAGVSGSPAIIRQNRIWGGRSGDASLIGSDNAGLGTGISISGNMPGNPSAQYLLFANNIVMDSQSGITGWWGPDQHISVVGNIIYNIRAFKSDVASNALEINSKQYSEWILNTIIDTDRWLVMGGTTNSGGASSNNDILCNVVINGGSAAVQLGSDNQIDSNAFFNTTPYSTSNTSRNLVFPTKEDAGSSDFCFYRKLQTGPEYTCIPNARPSSASPHRAGCSAALSTRSGIGVTK